MILLKQFQEGRARAVRELMIMLKSIQHLAYISRKKAYEKGLNVDGSREKLISALKKANELESKDDSEKLEEQPAED
jgi:hypothetical protein